MSRDTSQIESQINSSEDDFSGLSQADFDSGRFEIDSDEVREIVAMPSNERSKLGQNDLKVTPDF